MTIMNPKDLVPKNRTEWIEIANMAIRDFYFCGLGALLFLGVFASFTYSPYIAFQLFPRLWAFSLPAIPFSLIIFSSFGILLFFWKCNRNAVDSMLMLGFTYSSWELLVNNGLLLMPYHLFSGTPITPNPLIYSAWLGIITLTYIRIRNRMTFSLPVVLSIIVFVWFTELPINFLSLSFFDKIVLNVLASEFIWPAQIWFSFSIAKLQPKSIEPASISQEYRERKVCLMIMNPREIPECLNAFRSLNGVSKAWFKGYTELQLVPVIKKFIDETDYDYYIMSSDDLVPTQKALDAVIGNLHPSFCVTGWSCVAPNSDIVNIRLKPDKHLNLMYVVAWTFGKVIPDFMKHRLLNMTKDRVMPNIASKIRNEMPDVFRTYFVGFSFTAMSRELWIKYPFRVYSGAAFWVNKAGSDISLSNRLYNAGVPMYCVKNAEVLHLRSMANFIVGKVTPEVIVQKYDGMKIDAQ
jgi:hypothetical protein